MASRHACLLSNVVKEEIIIVRAICSFETEKNISEQNIEYCLGKYGNEKIDNDE